MGARTLNISISSDIHKLIRLNNYRHIFSQANVVTIHMSYSLTEVRNQNYLSEIIPNFCNV